MTFLCQNGREEEWTFASLEHTTSRAATRGWPRTLSDGVIALDAGGLTRSLTFDEQLAVEAVILSHRHFDHIRDLFPFGVYKGHSGELGRRFRHRRYDELRPGHPTEHE